MCCGTQSMSVCKLSSKQLLILSSLKDFTLFDLWKKTAYDFVRCKKSAENARECFNGSQKGFFLIEVCMRM